VAVGCLQVAVAFLNAVVVLAVVGVDPSPVET
jgi:hypothetical protein